MDDQVTIVDSEDALEISIHKVERERYHRIWNKNFNKQNENNGF